MKITAELIQASNNEVANRAIFTFKLTYPRRNMFLDFLGLSKYFERWLSVTEIVTGLYPGVILQNVSMYATVNTYLEIDEQVFTRWTFALKIFKAVRTKSPITATDIKRAIELFGPRFQEVLKQHKPGAVHSPPVENKGHHYATATEKGWAYNY